MDDFFDNVEIDVSGEEETMMPSCLFRIETELDEMCDYMGKRKYSGSLIKKIIERNIRSTVLSYETNIDCSVVVHNKDHINSMRMLPEIIVNVSGSFGNAQDIIKLLKSICFVANLPDGKMYIQRVWYNNFSECLRFYGMQMFLTEPVNTNIPHGFGLNFIRMVKIVDDILGCEDNSSEGEVIRHLGQYPYDVSSICDILKEHMVLVDDYNYRISSQYTEILDKEDKTTIDYIYPRYLNPDDVNVVTDANGVHLQSGWEFNILRHNVKINRDALYKLMKKPPCSVMVTVSITDVMDMMPRDVKGGVFVRNNLMWSKLWNSGIIVLNGFNNPKCKFEPQPLVVTMFDPDWHKLPEKVRDFINPEIIKTVKLQMNMPRRFYICSPSASSKENNVSVIVHLGQYMWNGRPQEVTLGLYGTRGRVLQYLQKIFNRIEMNLYEGIIIENH